jgi:hypothetical protein
LSIGRFFEVPIRVRDGEILVMSMIRRVAIVWLVPAILMTGGMAGAADGGKSSGSGGSRPDSSAITRLIDDLIDGPTPSKEKDARLADDSEFLRRVYLDLAGVIPPAEKVAAFLQDKSPAKRAKVIDELLDGPRYGLHQADRWETLLMIRDSSNRRLKGEPLYQWLADRFNKNQPWDRMVSDLLTAKGTQEENGATTFFIALRTPDKLTDQVTRLFLGVQLQCAQCHDHPFDRWKRADYWSTAAFFSKVRAGGKKVGLAKNGLEEVNEEGRGKKPPDVDSVLNLPPKFLGGESPKLKSGEPYRPVLATWMTSTENPYFARAIVNRTWSQFFGRGLVNPVDNITDKTALTHPELFDGLAKQLIASGFDLKVLIRGICNSRAYQRPSNPPGVSGEEESSYTRMAIRPMTPEQLFDSLASVLGTMNEDREPLKKGGKKALPTANRPRFVAFFDVPDGAEPTEYTVGIPQVLQLMNSPRLNRESSIVGELARAKLPAPQALERLYLATLSRQPSAAEVRKIGAFLQQGGRTPREAFEDVLWVLLNSSEFTLNH